MTIVTTTNRVFYVGNGATTVWTYGFLIPDASEVVVQLTNTTTGVVTTLTALQYSITGIGNSSGGTVTYSPALATGNTITIQRVLPVTQQTSLSNQGGFYPNVVEAALDYLTMVTQQLNDAVARALVYSPNGLTTIDALNNRLTNLLPGTGTSDAVTLAQLQAQFAASGNVPLPTVGQVGYWLKATGTGLFGWSVLTVTASQISDSTSTGRSLLTAASLLSAIDFFGTGEQTIASVAGTTDVFVTGVTSNNIAISGTNTITSLGSGTAGMVRTIRATGAWTLTNNANIIVPTGANVTAAAGDIIVVRAEGSGVTRVLDWQRASGQALSAPVSNTGKILQTLVSRPGTVATGTTIIPYDNTIPQITEGDQYLTQAITPGNVANTLIIDVCVTIGLSAAGDVTVALFQDSTANALDAMAVNINGAGVTRTVSFRYIMVAGTTSSTTFRVRIGPGTALTLTFNGSGGTQLYGGVAGSSIVVQEISA
jgi:hypothetical protein